MLIYILSIALLFKGYDWCLGRGWLVIHNTPNPDTSANDYSGIAFSGIPIDQKLNAFYVY